MPRFLLQCHAPTTGLAHVGTALAIGRELDRLGHDVAIAYGGARPDLVDSSGLRRIEVAEVDPEREWNPGQWYRTPEELEPVVDSHLRAIDGFGPDVAIACHSVPGRVAAELRRLPRIHVYHYLHTSPYARAVYVNRDRRRDIVRPRRALRIARARVRARRERGRETLRAAVAELRRARGLDAAPRGSLDGIEDTLVAISTAPFLVEARELPADWIYVGPIHWAPEAPLPEEPEGAGPLAYVTQGSTGTGELLARSVRELRADGFRVIATTADLIDPEQLSAGDRGVVAARLLDGTACMEAADVAIVHGGQQTLLDAVRAGTPVVAIPTRSDQIGQLHRIAELGIGRGLYPPPRLPGAIARAARKALRPFVTESCTQLSARLGTEWDGAANLAVISVRMAAGEVSPTLAPTAR